MTRRFKLILFFLVLLIPFGGAAQSGADSVTARLVLIGDAGALVNGRAPVMEAVRRHVPLDKKTTVLYLGDNLYREGLPDEQNIYYTQYRSVLDSQVALVLNTQAKAYFIPGNHDWHNGGADGYATVLRQQRYIDQISRDNVKFFPEGGCPGPVTVRVSDDVILIIIDSQWWLHPSEKPGIESDCPQKTKEEVLVELEDILSANDRKLVVFADHHPFKSYGVHGGFYTWRQHLFPFTDLYRNAWIPLPVLGSIYPISRSVFGSPQDIPHPVYADMIDRIEEVAKAHHHTIFVHGHEHNLQYIVDSNFSYIVSGSGCKIQRVSKGRKAEFVAAKRGFALMEVTRTKNVHLSFYTVEDSVSVPFRKLIRNFSSPAPIEDTIARTIPILEYKDSVLAPASLQYRKSGNARRLILGDNYRQEWSTPVMFKEFNITKEKGGFTIEGRGGGKQTKSLSLVDKKGDKWALRTIDKDPEQAIPENLRGGPAQDVVQDMISASHPYAPLVVPELARAVNVRQATPEIFFVPDDPALGYYRKLFANKIVFLERKDPVPSGIETKSTLSVINNMIEENDHVIDQKAVLKARLLDILIADFDRHMDQWKWAELDTGKGKVYSPIAKDRDQAFFYSDGLALEWASRRRLPFLRGFRYDIPKIEWFGYSARDFDRIFLNGLGRSDWENTIGEFQRQMTDSVIDRSVRRLPREIYPISGDTIAAKLKARRAKLGSAALRYFDFLSRKVNVLGSNKEEYFYVRGTDTGMRVQVYAKEPSGDTTMLVYDRVFDPKITKEIRLYGFNGSDRFSVEGKHGIRLRMIGGRGADTFNVKGRIKSLVYDLKTEPNHLYQGIRTKDRMSDDPSVNTFDVFEYNYGIKRYPRVNFGFNVEDGLMLGVGFWARTHGFRKNPYESDNKLSTLYSAFNGAYNIRYRGEFNHVFRHYDLLIFSDFYNPVLNNFFGLGNETRKDPETSMYYYRVRYKYLANDFMVRKRLFTNKLGVSVGPSFFHYWMRPEDNYNRILERPAEHGFDSSGVYGRKTYFGGRIHLDVNNLNNEFYPTRGINWNTQLVYLRGLNFNSTPLTRLQSDMTIYASLAEYNRLLGIFRLGGGHIFSDRFEYFQALNIGAQNFLRGFRKNRFSGSSLAYGSLEFRYKLFDVRSHILPGSFGLIGFDDIGRVWMRNEKSTKWHNAIGGGVYYLPFNLIGISATVAGSAEEVLFNFSVGTRLSFYF